MFCYYVCCGLDQLSFLPGRSSLYKSNHIRFTINSMCPLWLVSAFSISECDVTTIFNIFNKYKSYTIATDINSSVNIKIFEVMWSNQSQLLHFQQQPKTNSQSKSITVASSMFWKDSFWTMSCNAWNKQHKNVIFITIKTVWPICSLLFSQTNYIRTFICINALMY